MKMNKQYSKADIPMLLITLSLLAQHAKAELDSKFAEELKLVTEGLQQAFLTGQE